MINVTKEVFDDVLARLEGVAEPSEERDGEYLYETHYGADGEEIACEGWRDGKAVSWCVAEHTIK